MICEPIEIQDKLGRTVILRTPTPDDADALIQYLKVTSAETPYLIREPEEITLTHEQEELEVISSNTSAIALYKKLGFKKYGTFPNNMKYVDGTYESADWMMKKLWF